jgi:hypothetical protein
LKLKHFNGIKTTNLDKLGLHSSTIGETVFNNARVPNLLIRSGIEPVALQPGIALQILADVQQG